MVRWNAKKIVRKNAEGAPIKRFWWPKKCLACAASVWLEEIFVLRPKFFGLSCLYGIDAILICPRESNSPGSGKSITVMLCRSCCSSSKLAKLFEKHIEASGAVLTVEKRCLLVQDGIDGRWDDWQLIWEEFCHFRYYERNA